MRSGAELDKSKAGESNRRSFDFGRRDDLCSG